MPLVLSSFTILLQCEDMESSGKKRIPVQLLFITERLGLIEVCETKRQENVNRFLFLNAFINTNDTFTSFTETLCTI